ncbi:MAG TPA: acetyl-CoA carboxylase biotin carboxylase subunit [Gaiellaceae bacterium]|jgi:acetyl-CoA carboxylase, biotin carboxylase subunit|nr:acetyl-CoA carboxylase biotin carboxylase subunit [Gaiellaceae bacterium]
MFRRVLIANRGEVAVRIVRACHELGVEAVAVYSTADQDSLHVQLADQAVHVGPPAAAQSYLNIPSLVAAATTTGCDAVHPGWGFLAENATFAAACEGNDLAFVGPRPESIELMGDKIRAKEAAAAAGVPLVPGSDGAATLEQARTLAGEVGFPLLLKAAAGGGGRGMRLVATAEELEPAYRTAAAEAQAAFSDGSLYVERAIVGARHVEIQVLGDGEGRVLTLGERDCSIQRRHQKLVEEGPSPAVTEEIRAQMEDAARRATESLSYRGAGTIEFLLDAEGRFYFIEMNTRLQVEHPVTELLTGVDLAQGQLRVAAGEGLPQEGRAELRGHAIELRINAEDPAHDFRPAPGTVTRFRPPLGPGVRVDTHVFDGYVIPPFYDSLVAKVIVWAEDRPAALRRALRALTEFELEGVPTTRELAIDILESDEFAGGDYTTAFLGDVGGSFGSMTGEAA